MGRLGREPALAGEPLRRLRAGLDGPGRSPGGCLGSDAHVAWAPVAGLVGIVPRSGACFDQGGATVGVVSQSGRLGTGNAYNINRC